MTERQQRINAYVKICSPINKLGVRACLENPYEILKRMKPYILQEAKKKKEEPWVIVGRITGNGSGYSSAIWDVLINEEST